MKLRRRQKKAESLPEVRIEPGKAPNTVRIVVTKGSQPPDVFTVPTEPLLGPSERGRP